VVSVSEAQADSLTDVDDFIELDYVPEPVIQDANARWANAAQFPDLPNCDGPIRMSELQLALKQLEFGKAAGPDGIPSEIFKAARLDQQPADRTNGNQTEERMNPLSEVLLKLAQRMFDDSDVPESWRTADVVPVPKKGDPTNRDDYRGIALIPIGVKLLCKILNNRLSYAIELRTPEQGGFINEQAGFRTGEEAVGQVINLAEVYRRRLFKGKPTYLAFIDFKKAYDVVPHKELFEKMARMGVPKKLLKFIQSMYASSSMQVKLPNSTRSSAWKVSKGLRQGCPLSPLLFSIFINDIFDEETRKSGALVPGLGYNNKRLAGLLFADDLALLAGSVKDMRVLLDRCSQWADRWGMLVGHSKCGLMLICADQEREDLTTQLKNAADTLLLQGKEVVLVETYEYLGFIVHQSGEAEVAVENRASKMRKKILAIEHVLKSVDMPIFVKRMILNSVILPTGLYGAELTGMSVVRSRAMETLFNQAMRMSICGKREGAYSNNVLAIELGMHSIYASAASRRLRAYLKYEHQKTWIANVFFGDTFCAKKKTWKTGAKVWVEKNIPHTTKIMDMKPQQAAKALKELIQTKQLLTDAGAGLKCSLWYLNGGFQHSRHWHKLSLLFPEASMGFHLLLKMRIKAFWGFFKRTGVAESQAGAGAAKCLFCGWDCSGAGKTTHIVMECPALEDDRCDLLAPLIEEILGHSMETLEKDIDDVTMDEITIALLGGKGAEPDWYSGDSGRLKALIRSRRAVARRGVMKAMGGLLGKAYDELKDLDEASRKDLMAGKYSALVGNLPPKWGQELHRVAMAAGLGLSRYFALTVPGVDLSWEMHLGADLPAVRVAIFLTKVARRAESMDAITESKVPRTKTAVRPFSVARLGRR